MGRKRKRAGKGHEGDEKRQRIGGQKDGKEPIVKQVLLARYYQHISTLREYMLSKLPPHSKVRRKKILSIGKKGFGDEEDGEKLLRFLDQTLVGTISIQNEQSARQRWQQWTTFSQRADESISTLANLNGPSQFSQSEVS
jgi:telomerase reverse transcriptase